MSLLSAIRVALAALVVNKGRSALTSLGIVIGISAVIAMVAAGSGARRKLDERLESVGKNLILIRTGSRTQQGAVADFVWLKKEDADAIRKDASYYLLGSAPIQSTQRVARTATANWPTAVTGTTPDMEKIREWKVTYGRFFNEDDVKKMAPICLIGQTVRRKLFPDRPDCVGEKIQVDRLHLTVIGVTAEKGRLPTGGDQDDIVFVPITTLQRKIVGEERIGLILATAKTEAVIEKAKAEITRVMRQRHRLKPADADDFDVSSVREMAEMAEILTATMHILVAIIASISLIVGGIGIMNIMLVSVTERTREIGIRMAVGATGSDILAQFLLEAIALSLVGGVLGISLGVAGAVGAAQLAQWPLDIEPAIVALAFLVSAGVGIFFGYYPALKASRLDPIDALRYE